MMNAERKKTMEKVQVPAQPGRLINAVSRMGYDPEVALCDLMDNSLDAQATKISVLLERDTREESGDPDAIRRYIIADDGTGMDRDALINAFTLGASRTYPPGSLGKFGLGLKSAGLALGRTIAIITKTEEAKKPQCAILSIADIETSGEYRISLGDPPEELSKI
jgi:HSP90 family molecular chaperone